jgi:hypothetical protein
LSRREPRTCTAAGPPEPAVELDDSAALVTGEATDDDPGTCRRDTSAE